MEDVENIMDNYPESVQHTDDRGLVTEADDTFEKGKMVECPNCGEKSEMTDPRTAVLLGMEVTCYGCESQIEFSVENDQLQYEIDENYDP